MSNLVVFNRYIRDEKVQSYLSDVLRDKKDSFVTTLVSAVTNNAILQPCEPDTVMYAAVKATSLNLPIDPNLGFAYILPYRDNKTGKTLAQCQIGYKGLVQLAMRSGQFKTINVREVKDGEITGEDFLSGEMQFTKLAEDKRAKAKTCGYVAFFELLNGFKKMFYMSREEVTNHGKRFSQTFKKGYGLWASEESFDAMAKKTVLKMLLSKYAPMSIEMQSAIKADQAVYKDETMTEEYLDNQPTQEEEQIAEEIKTKAKKNSDKIKAAMEIAKEVEPVEETPMPSIEDMPYDEVLSIFESEKEGK